MNQIYKYTKNEINHFFNDIRFMGDEKTGSIRICNQNIKIERNLLNIESIAALFEVNPENLRQWIKTNKKHYLHLFNPEEYKKREEAEKKYKEEYKKIKEQVDKEFELKEQKTEKKDKEDEKTQTKTQVLKKRADQLKKDLGLDTKLDNIVDKDTLPNFMDPRLIIPAISSLNDKFNHWFTMTVIGGMCFDNTSVNIFSFANQFKDNTSEYMSAIQKEFENNKPKYAAEKKKERENVRNKASKAVDKSIVVVIPLSKTKLPYASTVMSEKASKYKTDLKNDFVDIIPIGNYKKMMEAFKKYLIEECKFAEDEVGKANEMKLQLSAKFTQEFYKSHKDKLIEYIKNNSTDGTVIAPKKVPVNVAKTGVPQKPIKENEQLKDKKSQSKKQKEKEKSELKGKSSDKSKKMKVGPIESISSSDSGSDSDDISSGFGESSSCSEE